MPTILQELRSGIAKADEYIRENELATHFGRLTTVTGFIIVLALVVLGLWPVCVVPQWQVNRYIDLNHELTLPKRLKLEDTYRKTITQIVLGVFGLFLLYFTWRRSVASDKTVRIAEQGHITDRFTKAIEQLGKTDGTVHNIEVRLGAIYALERIAIDSPRDHWTIMEILTAYVRQNAPIEYERPYRLGEKPRTDIQAILTVLGRRKVGPKCERLGQQLNLSESRLCGANLEQCNLHHVDLSRANLQDASLSGADLQMASLYQASLQKAELNEANMQETNLSEANLERASFAKANLLKACLWGTNLRKASFLASQSSRSDYTKSQPTKSKLH